MTLRTLFKFFVFIFGISPAFSTSDSSRVAELLKVVNENRGDSALAFTNTQKAYEVAVSSGNNKLIADVYIQQGIMYYMHFKYDTCLKTWKKASSLYFSVADSLNWAKSERLVGVAYDLLGKLDSSLDHLMMARDIYKQVGNQKGVGEVYLSLGIIQQKLKFFDAAVETNKLAIDLAMSEGNDRVLGPIYNNLGSVYTEIKLYDSGFKYLKLALSLQTKNTDPYGKSKILHNIGTIELERKNYKSAKNYYFTSLQLVSIENYEYLQGIISIGNCYLKLGQLDSSELVLKQAIEMNNNFRAAVLFQSAYKYLSQIEEKRGDYKKAFEYQKQYILFSDTIFNETLESSIHEVESGIQLEFEKEKNEALLKSSAEIEQLLEKKRQGVMLLLILSIVLVILIFILFRNMTRLRSGRTDLARMNDSLIQNAVELEENNRKLEHIMTNKNDLVSVMAHDLRSPFGKIQSIVELFNMSNDPEEQKSYLQMLDNITRDGMALIQDLIDLSRLEGNVLVDEHIQRLSSFHTADIFKDLKSSFTSHLAAKQLELELDLSDEVILNRQDYCERICDNILSNAIKYSNPGGKILVKSFVDNDKMKVLISDNGPGFKEEDMNRLFQRFSRLSARPTGIETSTGLGLYIAKKLAESIHGDIELVSKPGEPAKFCIEFPINLKSKLEA